MDQAVTVIGCGLIGGSIALAIKRKNPSWTVTALDLPERLAAIEEMGAADRTAPIDAMAEILPTSKLVILAAPVGKTLELLPAIAPHLHQGCIVTDVCGTKTAIVKRAAETLPKHATFIGGHPMAGAERSGVESADPLLFNNRVWILCPGPETPSDDLLFLIGFVEDMRAVIVTMEPEEHDKLVAVLSHAPQLLAIALMHCALSADRAHGMIETVAGRGFLDLTRIAASDFEVWRDVFATNKKAVFESLDMLEKSLGDVRSALENGTLESLWDPVRKRRAVMSPESLPRQRKPDLRVLIDRFDEQMLKSLANRLRAVKRIGRWKAERGEPVHDPVRERKLVDEREAWAQSLDLSPQLVRDLFELILKHSKAEQSK